MQIRNIAIIAHVDHGKTTLTDALMRQTGATSDSSGTMDSNALEQERGITIYAKNTSVMYKDTKINIVDTPGHADFGGEVERVLRSVDCVMLLVDAQEGPMPQTRFVLKKSLEIGHKPIVIINKIDKPAADPKRVMDDIFELFLELGATDEQANFTTLYAIGRDGVAIKSLEDERVDLSPMLDTILELVPRADNSENPAFIAQAFNLGYDNFVGRLAVCRVYSGSAKVGQTITIKTPEGVARSAKITKLFSFFGVVRTEVEEVTVGDIVMVAGISDVYIGETLTSDATTVPMPAITIDEPTITLDFLVNDSPFAGREGKFVTSRQIRERLERELEVNVGLRIDFGSDNFHVSGRGELHVAVLLEQMRREGFEVQVSQPKVIVKDIDGEKSEPFEELTVDVPTESSGAVIEKLTKRRGMMLDMREREGRTRAIFEIPTRGLLGFRGAFVIDTKGEGIIASRVIGFKPMAGTIERRDVGSMVSMISGKAAGYALWNLQDRGTLYIEHSAEVYEGMVIGNTAKGDEMTVNPIKGKNLTNVRSSGNDEAITLKPAYILSIERGLETMMADEFLEITPQSVRLRKKYLNDADRARNRTK